MIVHGSKRKGQVVIFVAFSMVALIGFLALSLDGGALLSERRHAQEAAFSAGGGVTVNVNDTPIIVDSTNPEGTIVNGSGTTVSAPTYDLTGGYTTTGGGQLLGTVDLNRPPTTDPFQFLPVPDPSTM